MPSNNDNNNSHRTTNTLLFGLLLGATSLTIYFGLKNKSLQVQTENLNKELEKNKLQTEVKFPSRFSGHDYFTALDIKETNTPVRGRISLSDKSALSNTVSKMDRKLVFENDKLDLLYDLDSELNNWNTETKQFEDLTAEYDGIVNAVIEGEPTAIDKNYNIEIADGSIHRHKNQFRARERRLKGYKPSIRKVGQNKKPANKFPLGLCEGECDTDEDCNGSLVCFHRDLDELAIVQGCSGGAKDESRTDYCIEETSLIPQIERSNNALKMQRPVLSSTNSQMKTLNLMLKDVALELLQQNNELKERKKTWDQEQQLLTGKGDELEKSNGDLKNQIQKLFAAGDGLKSKVNDSKQNNDLLKLNLLNVQNENKKLQEENKQYESLNTELETESIPELNTKVNTLSIENSKLTEENKILDTTKKNLSGSMVELESQAESLSKQRKQLNTEVGNLDDKINSLKDFNDEMATNMIAMSDEKDNLEARSDQLGKANQALTNVVDFLNETTFDFDQSVESVAGFLDKEIHNYRNLNLISIQHTYEHRTTHWDCNYNDWFGDSEFSKDADIIIPENKVNKVFEYIGKHVLDDLCLDTEDFKSYVNQLNSDELTTNGLVKAVDSYTETALNYYFPEKNNEFALTIEEWVAAKYKCDNLNTNRLYSAFNLNL